MHRTHALDPCRPDPTRARPDRRRSPWLTHGGRLGLALCLALLSGLIGQRSRDGMDARILAQGQAPPIRPLPGRWCGVTGDGGFVELEVSDDGRFVEQVTLTDARGGSTSSQEGGCVLGRAQVKNDQFIFKCGDGAGQRQTRPGGPGRCTKAPCRGDRPRDPGASNPTMIRGFFLSSEAARGNYTALTFRTVRSVSGERTMSRRIVGNYIAWPAGVLFCPWAPPRRPCETALRIDMRGGGAAGGIPRAIRTPLGPVPADGGMGEPRPRPILRRMATLDPFGPDPLAELARLWSRERRATQARFAAERRELPLSERVAQGLALRDLRLDETSAAAGGRLLVWLSCGRAGALDHLRIGPGDPVRLWWEDPEEAEAIRGVFTRRRGDRLGLMVEDRDDTLERLEGSGFRLDRDEPMATFDRGDKAIAQLAGAPRAGELGRLRELLLGQRRPERRREAPPERFHDRGLNPAQQAAVVLGLDAAELALIHGPPGTGKTRTLVELAWQAQARGERVLACAASNAAVDHLAEGLLAAGIELVRLGHPARVSPAIEPYTLDALVEAEPDYALAKGWMAEADRIRRRNSSRSERGLDRESKRAAYAEANGLSRDARRQLQQLLEHQRGQRRVPEEHGDHQPAGGRRQALCVSNSYPD